MKKVCLVFKHCGGHHLVFPLEIINFLQQQSYQIYFLMNYDCKDNIDKIKLYDKSKITYMSFHKIDFFSINKIFTFAKKKKIQKIIFPTLDEWLFDFKINYYRKKDLDSFEIIGILHYLKKNRDNKLFDLYDDLSSQSLKKLVLMNNFKLVLMNKNIMPFKEVNIFLLDHPVSLIEYPNKLPNNKKLELLLFGRMNTTKNIENILSLYMCVSDYCNLQIVGKFDASYKKKIDNFLSSFSEEKKKSIVIVDNFISDSEKSSYFINSDIIVIPYTNNSYAEGMESGIFYDALTYNKPIVFTEEFKTNKLLKFGFGFSISKDDTFKFAIDQVLSHYDDYKSNIKKYHLEKHKRFITGLHAIFK